MLLQEIRFIHALSEKKEITITERELPALKHISKYFDIKYKLGDKTSYSVKIDHEKPSVTFSEQVKILVFPKSMIRQEEKTIDYFFQGLTDTRDEFIKKFPNALIVKSDNGRVFPEKAYDKEYFDKMAKTKFALIPNGVSFPWSYRFFEAVMSCAIPIIEEPIPLYDGYKYFLINDKHEYREDYTKSNLEKFIKDLTI